MFSVYIANSFLYIFVIVLIKNKKERKKRWQAFVDYFMQENDGLLD